VNVRTFSVILGLFEWWTPRLRVDASLTVENAQGTSVTVTSELPLLKVDRADVSTILTTSELGSLAVLNRNVTLSVVETPA
jgi:hypothetical protein